MIVRSIFLSACNRREICSNYTGKYFCFKFENERKIVCMVLFMFEEQISKDFVTLLPPLDTLGLGEGQLLSQLQTSLEVNTDRSWGIGNIKRVHKIEENCKEAAS